LTTIQPFIIKVVALQQLAIHQHYSVMKMMVVFIMEANRIAREICMEL
jgi:hypothetical protein